MQDQEVKDGENPIEAPESLARLKELVEFLKASGVAEFDVERANLKLRLKFHSTLQAAAAPAPDLAQFAHLLAGAQANQAAPGVASMQGAAAPPAEPVAAQQSTHHIVTAPLVGTLYESAAPGAAPFVKVGDVVSVGQVLCIVEAMKLMNEVESTASGELVARLVENGQPVEYGQPIFEIRPR